MTTLAATPVVLLRVADIFPSPLNPRQHTSSPSFSEEKLRALGDSMRSSTGQLEAILVRPHPTKPGKHELVNGERRYRACKLVGLDTLAAKVREMDDAEVLDVMLAIGQGGNVESLSPLEEATGYKRLMELRGFDMVKLALHLGLTPLHVMRRLSLLQLPEPAQKALEKGTLSPSTAWHIARIPGEKIRAEASEKILNSAIHGGVMPTAAAAEFIESTICRTLKGAPFDTKDATLLTDAGACTTCRFRAGNNTEEYGDVGDKMKCMSPSCFEQKLAAMRTRVLAKEVQGGKIALTPEENAAAYPTGETGLAFTSEWVAYNQPPTLDLLKKEVSKVPTWKELCAERGVQVYVGIHQEGYAVDLVKLGEAFAAVAEPMIFNEDAIKRYGLAVDAAIIKAAAKGSSVEEIAKFKKLPVEHVKQVLDRHKTAGVASAPSQVAQEKAAEAARKKAEKAQKKKDRAIIEWLGELHDAVAKIRFSEGFGLWSLLYDLHAAALAEADVTFALNAIGAADDIEEGQTHRDALNEYASGLPSKDLPALAVVLAVIPRARAEGVDGALVKEWHETLVNPPAPTEPEAVAFQSLPPEEAARCTSIAKAHAAGMSVPKIAREFSTTVIEICGMLELDAVEVSAAWGVAQGDLAASFELQGVKVKDARPMIKLWAGREADIADLVPEEITKCLEGLSRVAMSKAGKPVKPADSE